VRRLEGWLRQGLSPLRSLPSVGDVRVIGGVGVLELVSDKISRTAGGYLDDVGPRLAAAFLERGLLLRPLGNILYFMPPFVITEDETAWAIAEIRDVLSGLSA
jgi:adenosylmethionine-8-amino-7-oxononanoate aminotransferase